MNQDELRSTKAKMDEFEKDRFKDFLSKAMLGVHCGLRGAKTGTKMPYDDFFLEVKYIS